MAQLRGATLVGVSMRGGPVWQPNYVDLSDDRAVSFGAECVVCQAHYVVTPVPLVALMPMMGQLDPQTAKAIEEQKYQVFADFDQAYRSILLTCRRCGNPACPDCWDVDKQVCGACVAEGGLMRAPPRGGPAQGPLADGFLRRAEPGRFSEIGRPTWLKDLLRAQSDPSSSTASAWPAAAPSEGPAGGAAGEVGISFGSSATSYPRVPALPFSQTHFDPPPTDKMATSPAENGPQPQPPSTGGLKGPEGDATSRVIECPRCGAPNYDFVTTCANCELQLIQICPACDHLNPAHAQVCQYCNASLSRPSGWSGVVRRIEPLNPGEARRRILSQPAPEYPLVPGPQVRRPARWSGGLVAQPPTPSQDTARQPTSVRAAPAQYAGPLVTPHPYDSVGGSELQPLIPDYQRSADAAAGRRRTVGTVSALVERFLVVALLFGLFAVVAVITTAETSSQANQVLIGVLHFDVKAHIDQLLRALHLMQPQR